LKLGVSRMNRSEGKSSRRARLLTSKCIATGNATRANPINVSGERKVIGEGGNNSSVSRAYDSSVCTACWRSAGGAA
jgi:hypothetical protein